MYKRYEKMENFSKKLKPEKRPNEHFRIEKKISLKKFLDA